MEGCKANKASSAYWQDKRRWTQTKTHEIVPNIKKKIVRENGQMLECIAQKIVVSIFGDIQNPTGHHSVQSDPANSG